MLSSAPLLEKSPRPLGNSSSPLKPASWRSKGATSRIHSPFLLKVERSWANGCSFQPARRCRSRMPGLKPTRTLITHIELRLLLFDEISKHPSRRTLHRIRAHRSGAAGVGLLHDHHVPDAEGNRARGRLHGIAAWRKA